MDLSGYFLVRITSAMLSHLAVVSHLALRCSTAETIFLNMESIQHRSSSNLSLLNCIHLLLSVINLDEATVFKSFTVCCLLDSQAFPQDVRLEGRL